MGPVAGRDSMSSMNSYEFLACILGTHESIHVHVMIVSASASWPVGRQMLQNLGDGWRTPRILA